MRVLDYKQRRLTTGQRRGIDQRGQPPPPGVGLDIGQLDVGIGDAEQIVQQQQIFGVGGVDACAGLRPGLYPRGPQYPSAARSRPVTAWKGMSLVCDSQ